MHCPVLDLSDSDARSIDNGIYRCLDIANWLHQVSGRAVLPTRKSFTAYGDTEVFGDESYSKVSLTIQIMNRLRTNLTPLIQKGDPK